MGAGEMGGKGQKIEASSCKSWDVKMYSLVTMVNNTALYN